jgi:hypothetical protein
LEPEHLVLGARSDSIAHSCIERRVRRQEPGVRIQHSREKQSKLRFS